MEKHVVLSSFEPTILKALRTAHDTIRLGVLDDHPQKALKLKLAAKIEAYSYHPNFRRLSLENVHQLHHAKLKIFPYTANTPSEFSLLRSLEVDGIITNEVEKLQAFLA